jgi:mannose-1-phosphate guanylyltransferase/mannose-6-phosphate isomerase
MLQETALRVAGIEHDPPVVVCNEALRFLVAEQLRQIDIVPRSIVLEPFGRNTAPAIALAALAALKSSPGQDPVLLVLPADHVVRDVKAFHAAVELATASAEQGAFATFGIVARTPETGFGYIRRGEPSTQGWRIAQFVEKPPLERAKQFVQSGEYYWNSGMFAFRAQRYLDELGRFAPAIAAACRKAFGGASTDADFTRIDARAFEACPSDSIDYAVMEKTADAVVVPLDAGWSDVGSWSALHEASTPDGNGNVLRGDVLAEDSTGCYLHSESRLVAVVGLRDHVVVETEDAVMVAPKDKVQDVKKLVARIKDAGRSEHSMHHHRAEKPGKIRRRP